MRKSNISDKKQLLYDAITSTPIVVGETVGVKGKFLSSVSNSEFEKSCTVVEILDEENLMVRETEGRGYHPVKVSIANVSRNLYQVGANPFDRKIHNVRTVNFNLESILFNLDVLGDKGRDTVIKGVHVKEMNWNPYVYNKKGKKEYYQRPFVWTVKDNQLLVESIYAGIECGRVLIRKRSWKEIEKQIANGEKHVAFQDIVDGKQRLNALRGFIKNEFPDLQGNYFNDLSDMSQHHFVDNQLIGYAEMPEESKDDEVLEQFLKVNFAGVPQSLEHIEFVRKIKNKI